MKSTTPEMLATLQKNPANIRNICILAHVDHGKTTLADSLVASNGIISQRMAGKLRYLDSRADEQLRGITMKSSAISIIYSQDGVDYLVNLIDSPGHIDFSSEVSTAVRLCDGAIIMVDVVEGVCPQTHAVLRQAWLENIRPVLVLNKIDRLIMELKLTPLEAFLHLQQVLEQVNAITGELFATEVMEKSTDTYNLNEKKDDVLSNGDEEVYDWSAGLEETDDSNLYFSPDQGNVIFASAIDGWGFSVNHFADMFANKVGLNAGVLRKTLWGDFYLEGKTKKVKKGAQSKCKKPLFVQFVLENIWNVYDAVLVRKDKEMRDKIIKSLSLKISARDTRHSDPRIHLQAIYNQWLPLQEAVLSMVCSKLPSPLAVSQEKVEKLLCSRSRRFDSLPLETQYLKQAFLACNHSSDAPVIVFVSKMFALEKSVLPKNRQRPLTQEEIAARRELAKARHAEKLVGNTVASDQCEKENEVACWTFEKVTCREKSSGKESAEDESDHVFIAFARIFSGTLRRGDKLYVLGPKHDPAVALQQITDHGEVETERCVQDLSSTKHITSFEVGDLYLFMGRELEYLDEIPAGNVIGLGGLEDHVLKSATLSSTVACPAFTDMHFEASPIVRVALEPTHPGEMKKLLQGLRLLNQADACVQVLVQETGEHVLVAAGEVHLQKCLDDLSQRYSKVEVNVSAPIVPFRETVVTPPTVDMVNEAIQPQLQITRPKPNNGDEQEQILSPGLVEIKSINGKCRLRIRAEPLPDDVTDLLEEHTELLKMLDQYSTARLWGKSEEQSNSKISAETLGAISSLKQKLRSSFHSAGPHWTNVVDSIWCFGPRRSGPNILVNKVDEYDRPSIWSSFENGQRNIRCGLWDYDNSVVSGFQMATLAGPMCEEPMMGVCFSLEGWDLDRERQTLDKTSKNESNEFKSTVCPCPVGKLQDQNKTDLPVPNISLPKPISSDISLSQSESADPSMLELESMTISADLTALDQTKDKVLCVHSEKYSSVNTEEEEICRTGAKFSCSPNENEALMEDYLDTMAEARTTLNKESSGQLTGQIMSCTKDGCRKAFQSQPQRLMTAMYTCIIQATADVLGKMYAVLGKRNGRVLNEDLREGSSVFNITAVLPVVESFGFAEEIRKRTSGLASPQLKFSHWEVVDIDPMWVPTTEEEYMHFGEKADSANIARAYVNQVRRRKGLKVDEKLIEHAEKQRTLSKNK